jgi:5'-nucleotidase
VDVIVAGHTHSALAHTVNGIGIVQAYSRGRAFARADIRVGADGSVHSVEVFPPHPLCNESQSHDCERYAGAAVEPVSKVQEAIVPALELAQQQRLKLLGVRVTQTVWLDPKRESPLGNLFADLMRQSVRGADVAIGNGGSLRSELASGPLTYGALYQAMPFDNRLAKIRLRAAELVEVLRRHLSHNQHGIVSVSGLRVQARCNGSELEVLLRRPDGAAIAQGQALTVVTSDYLATGGDKLFDPIDLEPRQIDLSSTTLLREALAARLSESYETLSGSDEKLYDPERPRLDLPQGRPIRCGSGH